MAVINSSFLKDTTLCAIIRDEMVNPAQLPGKSGIRSFVESHLPYVEQADIVDTGSIDGTRQELEQLASEFPNLRVHDHPFVNYVDARNFNHKLVKTPYSLVLDCDELITSSGFREVQEILPLESDKVGIYFNFVNVLPNGRKNEGGGHGIRFFRPNFICYNSTDGRVWEFPYIDGHRLNDYDREVARTKVVIFHFKPEERSCDKKLDEWYYKRDSNGNHDFSKSPTKCNSFMKWKKPNPHRTEYS
jgi:glycosyltransferase involved in cell wall biosynthesis